MQNTNTIPEHKRYSFHCDPTYGRILEEIIYKRAKLRCVYSATKFYIRSGDEKPDLIASLEAAGFTVIKDAEEQVGHGYHVEWTK